MSEAQQAAMIPPALEPPMLGVAYKPPGQSTTVNHW